MFDEKTLSLWTNVYFGSLILAAIAGAISIAAGFIQNRISSTILDKMKENVATANNSAAHANERAAEAELRSKELEIQLEKLRLAVAERFIPKFVAEALQSELQKYRNKKATILCSESSSDEPLQFSQKLYQLFQTSGWNTEFKNQHNTRIPPPRGIVVSANGEANREIAEYIHNQFVQLGYLISLNVQQTGESDITVLVLAK
jgi:hypothetical protein